MRAREPRFLASFNQTRWREELRVGFVSPDLRASFLATWRRAYELAIDLLMERYAGEPGAGHDRAAFALSEQARARTLLDALHAGRGGSGGSAVPAELRERRQTLRRRLSAVAARQAQATHGRAEDLEREMGALLTELDGVEAELRRHDPRYAAASEPPAIRAWPVRLRRSALPLRGTATQRSHRRPAPTLRTPPGVEPRGRRHCRPGPCRSGADRAMPRGNPGTVSSPSPTSTSSTSPRYRDPFSWAGFVLQGDWR